MAKNLNDELEKKRALEDNISDAITSFVGSMRFVYVHTIWFALWVLVNIGLIAVLHRFDPYPFGLLTLIVSLEAIFLSTFVMISQNRQAEREEQRAELDYETDVKAEKEIAYIKEVVEALAKDAGYEINNGKAVKENKTQGSS